MNCYLPMDIGKYYGKNIPHLNAKKIYEDACNRYFLLKSLSEENVYTALMYDIWATTSKNEKILKDAYETGVNVILLFSVNGTSRFSGYALMTSKPGEGKIKIAFPSPVSQTLHGKTFNILWVRCIDLLFSECDHLVNKLNSDKPVKATRDGQEIDHATGLELCKLFEDRFLNTKDTISDLNRGPNNLPFFMPIDNSIARTKVKHQVIEAAVEYNPAIAIFPVDLSNMSYETYISLYQCSQKHWLETPDE